MSQIERWTERACGAWTADMRTALRATVAVAFLALCSLAVPRATASSWPRGQDPWPKGNEWPAGEAGPYEARPKEAVEVTSFDGTVLRGTLYRPLVRPTLRVPAVIWSTPYQGNLDATTDDPDGAAARPIPVPLHELVRQGIAVLSVNVRGTGSSAGCLDIGGIDEQRDQVALVRWAGSRAWSNGRVGMIGQSYDGGTAFQAAVQAPGELKAIVAMDPATDSYLLNATPQGALLHAATPGSSAAYEGMQAPPVSRDPSTEAAGVEPLLGSPTDRACTSTASATASATTDVLTDHRNGPYYDVRRLTDRFPDVRAAVLFTQGFRDAAVQEYSSIAIGWEALRQAPKAARFEQMDHCQPMVADWRPRVVRWFAFWLQGIGQPPKELGTVEYQLADGQPGTCSVSSGAGPVLQSTAWPPAEAVDERLFLTGTSLARSPEPAGATGWSRSFVAAPHRASAAPCLPFDGAAVAFSSDPVRTDVDVAGNPFAQVEVTSTETGGIIDARLFAVDCSAPTTARQLAWGAVDLRFRSGNFDAVDFGVDPDHPTPVRIDLTTMAERVHPGERLVLVLGGPDPSERASAFQPVITVSGGSELVVPVVAGTTGGSREPGTYLPRPFLSR